jgi:hypothetical protein
MTGSMTTTYQVPDRNLGLDLMRVTEAAPSMPSTTSTRC